MMFISDFSGHQENLRVQLENKQLEVQASRGFRWEKTWDACMYLTTHSISLYIFEYIWYLLATPQQVFIIETLKRKGSVFSRCSFDTLAGAGQAKACHSARFIGMLTIVDRNRCYACVYLFMSVKPPLKALQLFMLVILGDMVSCSSAKR